MSRQYARYFVIAVVLALGGCDKGGNNKIILESHAYVSGKDLEQSCRSNDRIERAACVSYIYGVVDTLDNLHAVGNEKWLCNPPAAEKLVVAYINKINVTPELRESQASHAVILAMQDSYAGDCENIEIRGAG